jgi:hypothetical protein
LVIFVSVDASREVGGLPRTVAWAAYSASGVTVQSAAMGRVARGRGVGGREAGVKLQGSIHRVPWNELPDPVTLADGGLRPSASDVALMDGG